MVSHAKTVAVTLLACGLCAPAAAETVEWDFTGELPRFEVTSRGGAYDALAAPGGHFELEAELRIGDLPGEARVRSWTFGPAIAVKYPGELAVEAIDLVTYAAKQSYDAPLPATVDETLRTPPIPTVILTHRLIDLCRTLADKLRLQGKSDAEIFGSDQELSLQVFARVTVEYSWPGGNPRVYGFADPMAENATLLCRGS